MKNSSVAIIAGPCSVDTNNIDEIRQIAKMTVRDRQDKKQPAIAGTRIVGIKSRTELIESGEGMGIDYPALIENQEILMNGGTFEDFITPPSVKYTEEITTNTHMIVATEIMIPGIQLPLLQNKINKNKLLIWNPSVNQLGWQVHETAQYAKRNGWHIGIKNGKWLGAQVHIADTPEYTGQTTMEKTWLGLASYAKGIQGDIILIHRGVDVPDKGDYRNLPVHHVAKRTKQKGGVKLYFDPSHTYGPKMKDHIVEATIAAMQMKISDTEYLYDGILIEVGTSQTDTKQHITIDELQIIADEITKFRELQQFNDKNSELQFQLP